MGQNETDIRKEDAEMAEYQVVFQSGQIEGIEKAEDVIRETDMPDEVRKEVMNRLETLRKELRLERDKLI